MSSQRTERVMFSFPPDACESPVIYHLVKDFDLRINVFRAKVTPEESGFLVMDIAGETEAIERGLDYVRGLGIEVHYTVKGLQWDSQRCTSCGACLTHCPTRALHVADPATMAVDFDELKCVECLACTRVCPFAACRSVF